MKSYIPVTALDRAKMLKAVGINDISELFSDIPEQAKLKAPPDIPSMDEVELTRFFKKLAAKNMTGPCFLGAGAYNHFIPPVVGEIVSKAEFYTAYTPYQAEMSQGMLQAIYEYQTEICAITGMDVSNASVYDGATAAAEAMLCVKGITKKHVFLVSGAMHPDTLKVLKTYAHAHEISLQIIATKNGRTDIDDLKAKAVGAGGFLFSQPNFYGCLEEAFELSEIARNAGAVVVTSCDPISLGILTPPGEYADIAIGEGQPLGNPLSFGGPYLGFMAAKKKYMRALPGRMVGESVDKDGRRGFLLTLQAREQHIRREKAVSNICSNQALNAFAAVVYLATVGPEGLYETAKACVEKAYYAKIQIEKLKGYRLAFDASFFKEFAFVCPISVKKINERLKQRGIIGGLDLEPYGYKNTMLAAFTEMLSKEDIDTFIEVLKEVSA